MEKGAVIVKKKKKNSAFKIMPDEIHIDQCTEKKKKKNLTFFFNIILIN
jgi:hypothetical protein